VSRASASPRGFFIAFITALALSSVEDMSLTAWRIDWTCGMGWRVGVLG